MPSKATAENSIEERGSGCVEISRAMAENRRAMAESGIERRSGGKDMKGGEMKWRRMAKASIVTAKKR